MIYNEYGKTGLNVSAVGFGGMRFDEKKSHKENAQLLQHAYDRGINYFDTAPLYCSDTSEDIFGVAIKQMASFRDKFYVSTKGMPTEFDTAKKAVGAVKKSLKRLKTDYLDFYHVWCIRSMDQYRLAMKPGGQYEGLMKLKEQGIIRNIVISTHLRGDDVATIVDEGHFEGVLLGVNVLNFMYRWKGVCAAHDARCGVVAMNPLSGGMIPKFESELGFIASEGETPTEAAIRFCVASPEITIALIGFTTAEHIDTACKIADNCQPFTSDDLDRIKANVTENMDRICTGCGYCMSTCPQNIPIANYMQFYNNKAMFHKTDEEMIKDLDFEHQWGLLVGRDADAADCTQCAQCEKACTQHIDIIKRLAQLAQWETKLEAK
ncbi:MAG: 4Fe-4S dicluster domain-containing protein [Planctomycetes bacterium]|nr:4Fe-4S dicluster domain-containing protein [Planctomycetota bacterium]